MNISKIIRIDLGTTDPVVPVKEGDDTLRIRGLVEQLEQASQAIGQQIYAQQATAQQPGAGSRPQRRTSSLASTQGG